MKGVKQLNVIFLFINGFANSMLLPLTTLYLKGCLIMSDSKSRNFCAVLYPLEDKTHYEAIERLEALGFNYCGIQHDKDKFTEADEIENPSHVAGEYKKPHTHVVIKVKNPRSCSGIAQELGLASNYIQPCKNVKGALLYLVHANDPVRHQYDFEEVFGSLRFELGRHLDDTDEGARVLRILDLLDEMPCPCSYRRLLVAVCERGLYGEFRRMGSGVVRLLEEHNEAALVFNF